VTLVMHHLVLCANAADDRVVLDLRNVAKGDHVVERKEILEILRPDRVLEDLGRPAEFNRGASLCSAMALRSFASCVALAA
jgi:hypothetical protein